MSTGMIAYLGDASLGLKTLVNDKQSLSATVTLIFFGSDPIKKISIFIPSQPLPLQTLAQSTF